MTQKKYWIGTPPTTCQLCEGPIGNKFYDAATRRGWAYMCASCFPLYNGHLGLGSAQRYEREGERFVKTGG